jgi:methionyl-tRNA formyltransferase
MKNNIIFCGYRNWAFDVINKLKHHNNIRCIDILKSKEEFDKKINEYQIKIDIIIFLGWSWIISKEITDKYLCVGIHPSDLPKYRGGSPLQHQIINGVKKTKLTLMTLSSVKLDGGDVWLKQNLSLEGSNMKNIFKNLSDNTILLLDRFFNKYPNMNPIQPNLQDGTYFKRRREEESKIDIEDFKNKSLEDIYNFIRCLTDPYPNAFLEDEDGNKLFFKEVIFEKNVSKDDK